MKYTKVILFAFCTLLFSFEAISQTIILQCTGRTDGTNMKTTFDPITLKIDPKTGDIWDFPRYKAPGCSAIGNSRALDVTNNSTSEAFSLSCSNQNAVSSIRLSRYSGSLIIFTSFMKTDDTWTSNYLCQEAQKKF
jgi:hypothetical protein